MNRVMLADIEQEKLKRRQATTEAVRREYENNKHQRFVLNTESRPSV
jgi:hypothetical protein